MLSSQDIALFEESIRGFGSPTYNEDGLLVCTDCSFLEEARFRSAYSEGESKGGWKTKKRWRLHTTFWCAGISARLPDGGDFVECGAMRGGTPLAVMNYLNFREQYPEKRYWLFDTFKGLDLKYVLEEEIRRGIRNSYAVEGDWFPDVARIFQGSAQVVLVRGSIPETLEYFEGDKVCFVHLDMNCVVPEIRAAEFFWERLVRGGFMVLDDFGRRPHLLQHLAFEEFARVRGIEVLHSSTGQGVLMKPLGDG